MSNGAVSLTSNMEDYLEAVFHIVSTGKPARMKDIARAVGVRIASVSGAVRTLVDKGLVEHEGFGHVELTDAGAELARKIVRRHEVLTSFLADVLGVGGKLADDVACKMEHTVGPEVTERLVRFTEFVQTCPRAGQQWLAKFHDACEKGIDPKRCGECVDRCKDQSVEATNPSNGAQPLTVADLEGEQRGAVIGV